MAIKALFLSGRNDATTESLYQWDYGQQLEIESPDLGSMLCEVHFACNGMSEAIVRPCTLSAGIGNVTIPDDCLEQSSAITAWIYEKGANEAHGRTRGVITIPVVARTRPGVVRDIPPETNDQYTLLIQEVNDAIDDIENGKVKAKYAGDADTAKNAEHATTADSATTAGNANYANTAGTASSATNATSAGFATQAGRASTLNPTSLATLFLTDSVSSVNITEKGLYAVLFKNGFGEGLSFISISKKATNIIYSGTRFRCVPYGSDSLSEIGEAYATYDPIQSIIGVMHENTNEAQPITAVYKLAEI